MAKLTEELKLKIIEMNTDGLSSREIASELSIGKSTVNDFLNGDTHKDWWMGHDYKLEVDTGSRPNRNPQLEPSQTVNPLRVITGKSFKQYKTHLLIPDTQVKPDIDMDYLEWVGEYIVHKQPDVIIHIGDHFDLPSLSSYDKGTKKAEGKRLNDDINAGIVGMNLLLKPLYDLQQGQLSLYGEIKYKPQMVFTIGNHEQRLMRHVNSNPELDGLLNYSAFKLEEMGWDVYDFLEPAVVDGVCYIHYFPNPMTGKPLGGTALNRLNKVGHSVTMGHQQSLDMATRTNPITGVQEWWLTCGACYPHDEGYKGYTGNKHFRGVVMKHQVRNGGYSPMVVDLSYLERKYGG
jgi:hypothetical protein